MIPAAVITRSPVRFVAPVLLAVAAYVFVQDFSSWRWEWAAAADIAGLHTVLTGPLVAGICAWDTWQSRRWLATLTAGLPRPALTRLGPWLGCVCWVTLTQALVLAVYLVTAALSGAVGDLNPWSVLIQFSALSGYAAVGAWVGWRSSSPFAPPLLATGLLAISLLGVGSQIGLTRLTQIAGASSLFGADLDPLFAVLCLLFFVGLALSVVVSTVRRVRLAQGLTVVSLALSALAGAALLVTDHQRLRLDASPPLCGSYGRTQVCGPEALVDSYGPMAAELARLATPLRQLGVTGVPSDFDIGTRGLPVRRGRGAVEVTPETLRNPGQLRARLVAALTQPSSCDDLRPGAAPPSTRALQLRGAMTGWLASVVGTDNPERRYERVYLALAALSDEQRRQWMRATYPVLWRCQSAPLAYPSGYAPPTGGSQW